MNKIKAGIASLIAIIGISVPTTIAMDLESYIAQYNPSQAHMIATAIIDAGNTYSIDPALLTAIYEHESAFNNNAVSSAGAQGIAQLMPDTAAYLHVNPYNYRENILGGAKYLREMIDRYQDKGIWKYSYALAAYNAGPGNVDNGIPAYTYDYIATIQNNYNTIISSTDDRKKIKQNPRLKLLELYKMRKLKLLYSYRH